MYFYCTSNFSPEMMENFTLLLGLGEDPHFVILLLTMDDTIKKENSFANMIIMVSPYIFL